MPHLEIEIQQFDSQLELLYTRIAEIKTQKKIVVAKKRLADKAIAKLSSAVDRILELKAELGEEISDRANKIIGKIAIEESPSPSDSQTAATSNSIDASDGKLVEPAPKDNSSNEFFVFQPTENESVASYFDLLKEKVHCTYLGVSSKHKANVLVSHLNQWFNGLNIEIRKGSRLTTKYELKVFGLQETDIRWLAKQDFTVTAMEWQSPLNPETTRLLSSAIEQGSVTTGRLVYCPEDKTEYTVVACGKMRAELITKEGTSAFRYLNQLELVSDARASQVSRISEFMPAS